jgi:hypothetical protein
MVTTAKEMEALLANVKSRKVRGYVRTMRRASELRVLARRAEAEATVRRGTLTGAQLAEATRLLLSAGQVGV